MPEQKITITTYTLWGHQDMIDFMLYLGLKHPQGLPGLVAEEKTREEWEEIYQEWLKLEGEKNGI